MRATHVLAVTVPLNLDDQPPEYDPVKDALHIALSISRAAYSRHIVGEINVELTEVTQ